MTQFTLMPGDKLDLEVTPNGIMLRPLWPGHWRNIKEVRYPYFMIAKKTSKNQLTLPKKIVDQFPDIDYFHVRVEGGQIALVPVRSSEGDRLTEVHARLARLGLTAADVKKAVAWARSPRR